MSEHAHLITAKTDRELFTKAEPGDLIIRTTNWHSPTYLSARLDGKENSKEIVTYFLVIRKRKSLRSSLRLIEGYKSVSDWPGFQDRLGVLCFDGTQDEWTFGHSGEKPRRYLAEYVRFVILKADR